ncbi:MAG: hypothetical protein JKY94_01900 [Rhodobacteraceae bacterium]|nr:hypothetical protein [Paracoccaceae bacterium]
MAWSYGEQVRTAQIRVPLPNPRPTQPAPLLAPEITVTASPLQAFPTSPFVWAGLGLVVLAVVSTR